jgi:hypothetical protein
LTLIGPRFRRRAGAGKVSTALRGYRGIALILLLAAALLAVGGLVSGPVRHELALSFTRQPVGYTELYFSGDEMTVRPAGAGIVAVDTTFTIANHDDRATVFPYLVQVVDHSGTPLSGSWDELNVPGAGAVSTTATVDVPDLVDWAAVDVQLVGRPERLHLVRPTGTGG